MDTLFWLIFALASIWSVLYFRLSLLASTLIIVAATGIWTQFSDASWFFKVSAWIVLIAASIPLNIQSLRQRLISRKLLDLFRSVMPPMSQTEREAIEAGTVWWDGELFSGKPNWDILLNTPKPQLSTEEQEFLNGPAEQLCEMLDDWNTTHERHDLAPEIWQFIKDKGFFGMIIPKRYGGMEFSALAHSAVVTKIASRSITAAVTVMVPNSLGPAELILHYGTDEQKEHYLQRLAKGKEIPCFALTSPEAGSDAAAMTDTGIICRQNFNGEDNVLGILLNWEKRYITLGPAATVLGLAFKLYDPDKILGDIEELGITCALIPTDTKGVEIGARHYPLDSAFLNGPNRGVDVFIPMDWVIGGQAQVGKGWRMLMESLAAGRSISLPALSTGAAKLVSRATGAYARIRTQFKLPIGKFEGIEEVLARIAGATYMMSAARTFTTSALDLGEKPSVISAIVKYNMTEWMRTLINDGMDIHGGSGICLGPRNVLGRAYQTLPVSITVEGANILTRSLIVFGQGAIRCHPYVLKEMEAANETDNHKAVIDFDRALFGHIGFAMSNGARALFLGLTKAKLVKAPVNHQAAYYYKQLTRISSAFALVADVSMLILGGQLKRKEKLSGRLADVLSHMYLTSATLKRFEDQGQLVEDLPLLRWACENSLREMQQSLDRFLINFPNRIAAHVLRFLVFPLGKPYTGPTDALGKKAASILLSRSETRDRLTNGIYVPKDYVANSNDPVGRLEYALRCIITAEPMERKLLAAQKIGTIVGRDKQSLLDSALKEKILSQDDIEVIVKADKARQSAIAVDEFDADYFKQSNSATENTEATKECA